jgi:zona occludens toxin
MFTLITGLPGSSKSLQTIKLVETERVREDGSKRAVYYWGIPDLTLDWLPLHAPDITAEESRANFDLGVKELIAKRGAVDAERWHECPVDSIVVIDECHYVFPLLTQSQRSKPPGHYTPLAVHRHSGFDLYCMSQHPSLLAVEARRQVQRHWHLERPFGLGYANSLQWEKCMSPDDRANRNQANVVRMELDKKWFGVYRSAEVHTVKKRLPWKKLAVVIGSLVAVVVLFVFAFWQLRSHQRDEAVKELGLPTEQQRLQDKIAVHRWSVEDLTPRVATWPWTAPMYDSVVKLVSAPRVTGCMSMKIGSSFTCTCSDGQGVAQVSAAVCRDYLAGRYFDPTKEVQDVKAENIRRLDAAMQNQSSPDAAPGDEGGGRVVYQERS